MLAKLVRDAVISKEHYKRKTVFVTDITAALKLQGKALYGLQ